MTDFNDNDFSLSDINGRLIDLKNTVVICLIGIVVAICCFAAYRDYTYYHYTGELVGVIGTNVYHRDNCKFLKKVAGDKLILFPDKMAAAEAGYRPCKTCKPPDNAEEMAIIQKRKAEQKRQAEEAGKELAKGLEALKPDLNKFEILGSSLDKSLSLIGILKVTGTIRNNNDNVTWPIYVQAIFYDKNKKPIATAKERCDIPPGQIGGFVIEIHDNVENIDSYELQLIDEQK